MRLLPAFVVLLSLLTSSADGQPTPPGTPEARRPANDAELRYWLENMVWHHRFTVAEISAATGLSAGEATAALKRFGITPAGRPKRAAGAPLLVLPYPGGRHPRPAARGGSRVGWTSSGRRCSQPRSSCC